MSILKKLRALTVAGILGGVLGAVGGWVGVTIEEGLGPMVILRDLPTLLSVFGLMGVFSGLSYALTLMGIGSLSGRIRLNSAGGAILGALSTTMGVVLWVMLFGDLSSIMWSEMVVRMLPIGAVAGGAIGVAFRHAEDESELRAVDPGAELPRG